ncbi:hypothetical protein BX661DRAFT_183777 [Kickxella alabastrina]|uniref:uncharacterized protein n=1 Tax=Kickxella alabastrina TaxID=61397 RepID=UPI0022206545|nr:uncharacterized protein BX661DRAFT_183777 [Kickxella alabastrina]KAI7826312.1 hypothetical protein BX661DRAFT_183777 [Kickxella alabastrina]
MIILRICTIFFAQLFVHLAHAQGGCSRIVTRRDITSLSPQEWNQVSSVLRRMNDDGWFRYFADIHNREFGNIHGNDHFFPFHRRFLLDFEEIGQRYDPNFAVPYWDELRDSRNPAASPVLSSRFIGGNSFGQCLREGLQSGWTMTYPNGHCLTRNYDRGNQMQPWYSPEYIYSVMQRFGDMHSFREAIEFSLHGSVHLGMGGDMAAMYSSNDFAFMLHHANLDRLWNEWQSWGHSMTMDGRDRGGSSIGLGSRLPHYGDDVGSTMRLGVNRMCFRYQGGTNRRRANALSMVAMPSGSNSSDADTNLGKLPLNILQKWFPQVAHETASLGSTNSNSARGSMASGPAFGRLCMHKFDQRKVAEIMKDARDFVDEMNRVNYLSPF